MPFGIIWESFFSMGSQVIWLPVLIHYLPPDILGLWYVFVSIGGLVELVDSGFTPTPSHCMTYAWSGAADLKKHGVSFSSEKSEPNYALVCGMLATCRRLYFAIALAATLLMATLGTVLYPADCGGVPLMADLCDMGALYRLDVHQSLHRLLLDCPDWYR